MARKKHGNRLEGLQVKVFNNNVEGALKKFKRKVKDSEMMLELKKRSFYKKKSELKREKRNLAKLRQRYKTIKENNFD
jgi:ribosomal protein S21